MPKYKIIHSLLQTPTRDFMQDDIVTARQLQEAGTDLAFLLNHGTIAVLEGTEDEPDESSASDPSEADTLRAELAMLRQQLAAGVNAQPPASPQSQRAAAANKNQDAPKPENGLSADPNAESSARPDKAAN